jgi:hypothetical protein
LRQSHVGTYALPTALRYQNVQQKERGMSVFPWRANFFLERRKGEVRRIFLPHR